MSHTKIIYPDEVRELMSFKDWMISIAYAKAYLNDFGARASFRLGEMMDTPGLTSEAREVMNGIVFAIGYINSLQLHNFDMFNFDFDDQVAAEFKKSFEEGLSAETGIPASGQAS